MLAAGFVRGPGPDWAALTPHPLDCAALLSADLTVFRRLNPGLPLSNRHWPLPLRLPFPSMALTVVRHRPPTGSA